MQRSKRFILRMNALKYIGSIALSLLSMASFAQKDLFQSTKQPARKGFLLGANGNFDFAAGDMANRFGNNYRIGPSLQYKTLKNWIFGVKMDFINGDKVKNRSALFSGISDASGYFFNQDGQRIGINVYERGYMAGLEFGYVYNTSKRVGDQGIMLLTGIGFMQHKILIQDKSESIFPLRGDYRKGYDHLTNGLYVEQYLGYLFMSHNGLVNFHAGLDIALGFTQGRRDFNFDTHTSGNDHRTDILVGIRGGWYLPFFKRKSEELFFE